MLLKKTEEWNFSFLQVDLDFLNTIVKNKTK